MGQTGHVTGVALIIAGCLFGGSRTSLAGEGASVEGLWQTEQGKAVVKVYPCGELFCGRILWLKEPVKDGAPVADGENPVDSLRSRPVLGLLIMEGFRDDGDGEWTGGSIYDPESGDTYSAKMILQDERTLELRGYVLIPLFGRSEIWTRVDELPSTVPD